MLSVGKRLIKVNKGVPLTLFGVWYSWWRWTFLRYWIMMTSSNRNIFRVTGPLCVEFTGHRWIPRTKASDAELWYFFICTRINDWVNNREAGDLRRHGAHYDIIVMCWETQAGIRLSYTHGIRGRFTGTGRTTLLLEQCVWCYTEKYGLISLGTHCITTANRSATVYVMWHIQYFLVTL